MIGCFNYFLCTCGIQAGVSWCLDASRCDRGCPWQPCVVLFKLYIQTLSRSHKHRNMFLNRICTNIYVKNILCGWQQHNSDQSLVHAVFLLWKCLWFKDCVKLTTTPCLVHLQAVCVCVCLVWSVWSMDHPCSCIDSDILPVYRPSSPVHCMAVSELDMGHFSRTRPDPTRPMQK